MSSTTVLLPTCPFPPVQYMAFLLQMPGKCVVEQHETYSKQTYRNRYTIAGANGRLELVIPVNKPNGNNSKIKDVLISNHNLPLKNHFTALVAAYNSSPYFEYFIDEIEEFYNQNHKSLIDFNIASLYCVSNILRHKFNYTFSADFMHPLTVDKKVIDLRFQFSPKNENFQLFQFPSYYQVFKKNGFIGGLSILDLVFNMGKESLLYLQKFPL